MKRRIRLIAGIAVSLICMLSNSCFAEESEEMLHSGEWEYVRNEDETVTITGWSGEEKNLSIPAELDEQRVTGIGEDAFYACTDLTEITIPDGVTEIGNYAFSFCHGLTDVEIPASVTKIGEFAFSDCSNLTSVRIPDSATEIGKDAFYGDKKLTLGDQLLEKVE